MWGFQSLRQSVQNQASGLLRSLSDRMVGDGATQGDTKPCHRDAMQNVVTPRSIPQFTLPPKLTQDATFERLNDQGSQEYTDKKQVTPSISMVTNGQFSSDLFDVPTAFENVQISHSDQRADLGHDFARRRKRSNGSNSSLSIKNLIQRKRSDGRAQLVSTGLEKTSKATVISRENANPSEAGQGELDHPGMSLQHLVAKKSGFSTLSESPNTRRKESLFFAPESQHESQYIKEFGNSPVSDGNNSSCCSTPRGSPALSSRRLPFSASEERKKLKKSARVDSGQIRRGSFNEEPIGLSSSDTDDISPTNLTKRRMSVSEQDINKKSGPLLTSSIRLCLTYLAKHRRLNVSILEGRNFITRHSIYLRVTLLPRQDKGHRTEPILIQDSNPIIRERLTFESVDKEDIPLMSLKICCKEKSSRIRHADIIGECILALCNINFQSPNDLWVNFNPYKQEEAPHIQLSLCYDAMLGCLTVDVVAARNVPKGSLGRQPDCYVTLTESLPSAKVVKKQTKIVHRTQDPVFRESFLFSLCTDAQTPDQLVIIATLYVKDRVRGSTESVGKALLGQLVDNWSGRSQWAQALANEGEAVTQWHRLIPPNN